MADEDGHKRRDSATKTNWKIRTGKRMMVVGQNESENHRENSILGVEKNTSGRVSYGSRLS